MAQRLDRGIALQKPTKLENGWMRIDGRITRTGIFTYRLPDGKLRRELRLPEEVFKTDAMQSFSLVPVTDEHPPAFLDATNTKEFARGSVAGTLRQDGQFIAGEMLVTDADLIAKLEKGKAREISCGYTCDLEESPGELNGERYDAIQRNIRGNHVAIVERGRAGPEARVRMDAAVCTEDGDDDQPRDESGRWSSTGAASGKSSVSLQSPSLMSGPTAAAKVAQGIISRNMTRAGALQAFEAVAHTMNESAKRYALNKLNAFYDREERDNPKSAREKVISKASIEPHAYSWNTLKLRKPKP